MEKKYKNITNFLDLSQEDIINKYEEYIKSTREGNEVYNLAVEFVFFFLLFESSKMYKEKLSKEKIVSQKNIKKYLEEARKIYNYQFESYSEIIWKYNFLNNAKDFLYKAISSIYLIDQQSEKMKILYLGDNYIKTCGDILSNGPKEDVINDYIENLSLRQTYIGRLPYDFGINKRDDNSFLNIEGISDKYRKSYFAKNISIKIIKCIYNMEKDRGDILAAKRFALYAYLNHHIKDIKEDLSSERIMFEAVQDVLSELNYQRLKLYDILVSFPYGAYRFLDIIGDYLIEEGLCFDDKKNQKILNEGLLSLLPKREHNSDYVYDFFLKTHNIILNRAKINLNIYKTKEE